MDRRKSDNSATLGLIAPVPSDYANMIMMRTHIRICPILFLAVTGLARIATPLMAKELDFAHDIVPILRQHCGKCHTGDQKKGGFSLNTRESVLAGGESGKVAFEGRGAASELIQRIVSTDDTLKMPPDGPRVPAEQIALLTKWIDAKLPWEPGFTFGLRNYEPPLKPRRPELPPVVAGRAHPVDRIIDAYLLKQKKSRPAAIDDLAFVRRAYLDIVGLLPSPEEVNGFSRDSRAGKRELLVQDLLARDIEYAEHWLTFWNDLLRNDYTGTGFITGGRKQITKWLYHALVTNRPYDEMARELIAPPTAESAGFADGIRWRGDVSAGQTVEIQFAQSVGQAFLGINLKCASCHDSFVDRWKLSEAYGLAAIYSTRPLEIHRCDKPIGQTASAAWLFPELGQIDPKAEQPVRLKQLAALMTHPENGRFPRTIVNRIWHRMLGRGIVHPTDAMQSEPWSSDLLDYLASDLADHKFDLKQTIALIATSQAYQERVQQVTKDLDERNYVYGGPRAKRLTAEQFMDAVWQLTDAAPTQFDAQVLRGKSGPENKSSALVGKWIWSRADVSQAAAGETVTVRRIWELKTAPTQALAAISCDNSYSLSINGQYVHSGENWEVPDSVLLTNRLQAGKNEIVIVAKNGGSGPNPAGLFFEARACNAEGSCEAVGTDEQWQWTSQQPERNGKFKVEPADWKPAVPVAHPEVWSNRLNPEITSLLARGGQAAGLMVRASLVKSDFLMRSLGRPNRDQIVSVRPAYLTTLEAIDLSNGQILAETLERGSRKLLAKNWKSSTEFVQWLYRFALSREPSAEELAVLTESLGPKLTEQGIQDVLWSVIMLPEFQMVR
jgi:mono/diheme cytochrome c family protein